MYKFKFKNGDTIEMKAIKHSAFASEETHCYQAKIYMNGKAWIQVDNDGRGGADRQSPMDIHAEWGKQIKDINQRLQIEHEPETYRYEDKDGKLITNSMKVNLEIWCGNQINKWLMSKDLKNKMAKNLLFIENKNKTNEPELNGFTKKYLSKFKPHALTKFMEENYPNGLILNDIDFNEALNWYKQAN